MSNFDDAFEIVVMNPEVEGGSKADGGYTNDPADPGGETKFGLSKRAHPELDIKNLSVDQAKEIYEREYWKTAGCAVMPRAEAICVFDSAVNQGVGYALSTWVSSRGLTDFMSRRAMSYTANVNFKTYGHGWLRRLFTVYRLALKG